MTIREVAKAADAGVETIRCDERKRLITQLRRPKFLRGPRAWPAGEEQARAHAANGLSKTLGPHGSSPDCLQDRRADVLVVVHHIEAMLGIRKMDGSPDRGELVESLVHR